MTHTAGEFSSLLYIASSPYTDSDQFARERNYLANSNYSKRADELLIVVYLGLCCHN